MVQIATVTRAQTLVFVCDEYSNDNYNDGNGDERCTIIAAGELSQFVVYVSCK